MVHTRFARGAATDRFHVGALLRRNDHGLRARLERVTTTVGFAVRRTAASIHFTGGVWGDGNADGGKDVKVVILRFFGELFNKLPFFLRSLKNKKITTRSVQNRQNRCLPKDVLSPRFRRKKLRRGLLCTFLKHFDARLQRTATLCSAPGEHR